VSETSVPQCLYRFYDAKDRLLYIGITVSLFRRWNNHNALKPWWRKVTRATVEHFPDRASVMRAERNAIRAEMPIYNVSHNAQVKDAGGRTRIATREVSRVPCACGCGKIPKGESSKYCAGHSTIEEFRCGQKALSTNGRAQVAAKNRGGPRRPTCACGCSEIPKMESSRYCAGHNTIEFCRRQKTLLT
jgi:hypothetical protein